jgi:hypothetical protein
MPTLAKRIVALLAEAPGPSDREITHRLFSREPKPVRRHGRIAFRSGRRGGRLAVIARPAVDRFCLCAVLLVTASLWLLPEHPKAQSRNGPFDVFVFTIEHDQAGFIDAAARDRKNSVADIKSAIRYGGFSLRRTLRLTENRDQAKLQIEVASRAITEGNGRVSVATVPLPNMAVGRSRPDRVYEIHAMLSVGSLSREFDVTQSEGTWSELAARLVDEIAKFTKDNRAKLSELASGRQ